MPPAPSLCPIIFHAGLPFCHFIYQLNFSASASAAAFPSAPASAYCLWLELMDTPHWLRRCTLLIMRAACVCVCLLWFLPHPDPCSPLSLYPCLAPCLYPRLLNSSCISISSLGFFTLINYWLMETLANQESLRVFSLFASLFLSLSLPLSLSFSVSLCLSADLFVCRAVVQPDKFDTHSQVKEQRQIEFPSRHMSYSIQICTIYIYAYL